MFRYRMVSHTADIRVRVSSPTLEGLFQGAALSLCSLHVDRRRVREREAVKVSAEGYDMEDLLFNFLRECFSLIAVESFVYRRADVRIEDGGRVGATLRG
ncbi:MAG: archease, partial [Deltaproteobacteria bacterium]